MQNDNVKLWRTCGFAAAVSGTSWKLQGDGYIMFAESHGLANVRLPWLNSLLFRTRQSSAVLMSVDVGVGPQHVLVIQVGIAADATYVCPGFVLL